MSQLLIAECRVKLSALTLFRFQMDGNESGTSKSVKKWDYYPVTCFEKRQTDDESISIFLAQTPNFTNRQVL